MHDFVVVSFFNDVDGTDYYKLSAKKLEDVCTLSGLKNYIVKRDYGSRWIDNVRAKPVFLRECMSKFIEDILWVDADCIVNSKIKHDISRLPPACEWGFARNQENPALQPADYIHYIKNTKRNLKFLDLWEHTINNIQKGSHTALREIYKKLNYEWLSTESSRLGVANTESRRNYFKGK